MCTEGIAGGDSHPHVELCTVNNKENHSGTVDDSMVVSQNRKQNYHKVKQSNILVFYQWK